MKIKLNRFGGGQVLLYDEPSLEFGAYFTTLSENEVIEQVKAQKPTNLMSIDEWNLHKFTPLMHNNSVVRFVSKHIWYSNYTGHYLFYGYFYIEKNGKMEPVTFSVDHDIAPNYIAHLPQISFWLLFNTPEKHLRGDIHVYD